MGKTKDKQQSLSNILLDAASLPSASPAFIGLEEGLRVLATLESGITANRKRPNLTPRPGEHPLYEFHMTKSGNYYEYPIVQKVFDLLKDNGHGKQTSSYVGKFDPKGNEFRQKLNSLDPSWIADLDMDNFGKLVYMYGSTGGGTDPHGVASRLCDGTIHAMLKRGMELGPYKKPEQQPAVAPLSPPRFR
jgi:hypothetical protein